MMIDLIASNGVYHYRRVIAGTEQKGRIRIGERVKKANGWYLIGTDTKSGRYMELRPVQVLRPFISRKAA